MRPIPLVRFDAIAGYARGPLARVYAEELAWFEHAGGQVVGMLVRDRYDRDYGGLVFAPDAKMRFRNVDIVGFDDSRRQVEIHLRRAMESAAHAEAEAHFQGDEVGKPIDFFTYTRSRERLNKDFLDLAEQEGYGAAKRVIALMMRWYEDVDGNFVEQFQTTGFDQRLWELYLFAAFTEMGYVLDRRDAVPDYTLNGPEWRIAVEAVTVGPSRGGSLGDPPDLNDSEGQRAFLREYMPIKFGSALFSKLQRHYWEQPQVAGHPLVFAIEDFSAPGSMVHTRSALDVYLYGMDHDWEHDADGRLVITARPVTEHRWGKKVIPSGFFAQPGAENVSAVLFSNSGTLAKFSRMGVLAGFGAPNVVVVREGTAVDHDPNASSPLVFRHIVNDPDYAEDWVEGVDVFHNPKALHPVDEHCFPGAAHHYLREDGQRLSKTPEWHPYGSRTIHLVGADVQAVMDELGQ